MSDRTPEENLARARVVEEYLIYELRATRRKITELEDAVVEAERRRKVAYRENRFAVERTWSDEDPDVMHRGGCRKHPTRSDDDLMQAPEAALMMRDRHMTGCETCNPLPALRSVYLTPPIGDDGA
ncbi:hypothetical protein AB0J38_25945 [Streptomyces sp. NPDC050095]|uniref:hypothetical protein n=1 Tax=unclassified Streptomyces TaxID=2593676 RepID=UPI0034131263